MDRKRTYSAFTLVEMLIVMGIVIILMAVGITAGRYAINRANDVAHRNAVDQIYQALQAYYADEREFPRASEAGTVPTPGFLVQTTLADYMDSGTFDGGTDATYYYDVSNDGQSVLVCVDLGGLADEMKYGIYCNGNGFNNGEEMSVEVADKEVPYNEEVTSVYDSIHAEFMAADWERDGRTWTDR